MATARRSSGRLNEIIKITANFSHLPALPTLIERVDAWTPVLQEPLLYLEGSHPLSGTIPNHRIRRHHFTSVLMSIRPSGNFDMTPAKIFFFRFDAP